MKIEMVLPWADVLRRDLSPGCERIEFGGSLRRGRADVKDVEIVAIPKRIADLFGGSADGPTELDALIARLVKADLFCGAGGFSTGLLRAAAARGVPVELLAVNHWPVAVETHAANHPGVAHYCESIEGVEPLGTITARDRFALVSPEMVDAEMVDKGDVVALLDIQFRMLQPRELAAAHSFPTDYHFAGTRDDQVRQVGNSVGVGQAEALCGNAIGEMKL